MKHWEHYQQHQEQDIHLKDGLRQHQEERRYQQQRQCQQVIQHIMHNGQ